MLIVVIAGGEDQKEFQDKEIPEGVQVQFVTTLEEAKPSADAYFFLTNEAEVTSAFQKLESLSAPVFIKSANNLQSLPTNIAKISPWPGFLFAESIQVNSSAEIAAKVTEVLNHLQWKFHHAENQ